MKTIQLQGYDRVAQAQCDFGTVVVLNNNHNFFLLVDLDEPDDATGEVVRTFEYGDAFTALKDALEAMVQRMLTLSESLKEAELTRLWPLDPRD
jgi:hypothetical protein